MIRDAAVIILISLLCFRSFFVLNRALRLYFVMQGYEKTGSAAKRRKACSARFNMPQRVLLIPLLTASSDDGKARYTVLGVMNYLHFVFAVLSVATFILDRHGFTLLYD